MSYNNWYVIHKYNYLVIMCNFLVLTLGFVLYGINIGVEDKELPTLI